VKCKVRLTHTVEMFVEGKSEDAIYDWICSATPQLAYEAAEGKVYDNTYSEDILCTVDDDSEVDYVIPD